MRATPAEQRYAERTRRDGDCLVWTGALVRGYGQFSASGQRVYVHRWAWEQVNGPVPAGMELDHLCRNRACVLAIHLEPVTHRENHLRSPIQSASKTHCPLGHGYTPTNTYRNPAGSRVCRTCKRARAAEYRARRAAA